MGIMGMWRRIKEQADKEGWFTLISFHLALLCSVMYVLDIGSDIILAYRYYVKGDLGWGICTTSFIVIPWILQLGVVVLDSCISYKRMKKTKNEDAGRDAGRTDGDDPETGNTVDRAGMDVRAGSRSDAGSEVPSCTKGGAGGAISISEGAGIENIVAGTESVEPGCKRVGGEIRESSVTEVEASRAWEDRKKKFG